MWWLRVSFQNRDAITIKQLQQQQNLFLVVNGNVHNEGVNWDRLQVNQLNCEDNNFRVLYPYTLKSLSSKEKKGKYT
jgi:hypothetical protein